MPTLLWMSKSFFDLPHINIIFFFFFARNFFLIELLNKDPKKFVYLKQNKSKPK